MHEHRTELPSADSDPVEAAREWIRAAAGADLALHDAVCLATCSADGAPSARMVLCREVVNGRFLFYTDYRSRKARELDAGRRAAMVFHWAPLSRQLRVEGSVDRLDPLSSDRYFLSRPRASRISAWSSHQSAGVSSRHQLQTRRSAVERRFEGLEVPRPDWWGGYALLPSRIEFWVGSDDRFHERIEFRRAGAAWVAALLEP